MGDFSVWISKLNFFFVNYKPSSEESLFVPKSTEALFSQDLLTAQNRLHYKYLNIILNNFVQNDNILVMTVNLVNYKA